MPKKINVMENANVMNDIAFRDLWRLAISEPDEDEFIAKADCPDGDLLVVQDQLHKLWHVANDSFRDLLDAFGIKQIQCSERFCVPFSTVRKWAGGFSECPPYIRLMMAEALGYITLRNM